MAELEEELELVDEMGEKVGEGEAEDDGYGDEDFEEEAASPVGKGGLEATTRVGDDVAYMPDSDFQALMDGKLAEAMALVKSQKWEEAAQKLEERKSVLDKYKTLVKDEKASLLEDADSVDYAKVSQRASAIQLCSSMQSFVPVDGQKKFSKFSKQAQNLAERIEQLVSDSLKETEDYKKKEKAFAASAQFGAAQTVKMAMMTQMNNARTKMDDLFNRAADNGGAADAFRSLHERICRIPHYDVPAPAPTAEGEQAGEAKAKGGLLASKIKTHGLGKAARAQARARLEAPQKKKVDDDVDASGTFAERHRARMEAIREEHKRGAQEGSARTDHLEIYKQRMENEKNKGKQCKCTWLRCSHNPVFTPGNKPIVATASPDGLFTIRQRTYISKPPLANTQTSMQRTRR